MEDVLPHIFAQKGEADVNNRSRKTQKSPRVLNGSAIESQKKKNVLSQSVSFPSRGSLANNFRSITTSTRQTKVASLITNGTVSSSFLFQQITFSPAKCYSLTLR